MRILIDTNILFSVALYPNSVPQRAFEKAVSLPNIGIVSPQIMTAREFLSLNDL